MRRTQHRLSALHIFRGLQLLAQEFVPCPFSTSNASSSAASPSSSSTSPGQHPTTQLNQATIEAISQLEKGKSPDGSVSPIKVQQVPSTRTGRAFVFGSLVLRLGWDKLTNPNPQGTIISREGHEQIAATLCRMRGAVLKLGQMLSIQDDKTVPAAVTQVFERVRDSAFAMPESQLRDVLSKAFGVDWRTTTFHDFEMQPRAAASIGQVHVATLPPDASSPPAHSPSHNNRGSLVPQPHQVAVKVQYPGVAASIDSDVANLKLLISLNLMPKGMFVDNILKELRQELSLECQYTVEAQKQERYRLLVASDAKLNQVFVVPKVHLALCRDNILVTDFVRGVNIDIVAKMSQQQQQQQGKPAAKGNDEGKGMIPQDFKNYLAEHLMLLTLTELFVWRFMQTDPNFSNFLFDASSSKINLLDFGAAREYEEGFVRDYLEVVAAAAREDRATIIDRSIKLGFLTGQESKEMLDAHCSSVIILGKPFKNRDAAFDFSSEHLPSQIQAHVPTMLRLRLRPPPTPIYSLHRRLSGTILLCTKFDAVIPSGKMFWDIYDAVIGGGRR